MFLSFGLGVLASILFTVFFTDWTNYEEVHKTCSKLNSAPKYIYSAERWSVQINRSLALSLQKAQNKKLIRPNFSATELGIRERLVVLVFGQSSLSFALNTLLKTHVPHVQIFFDAERVDNDLSTLSNLTPLRRNGQHSHIHILNAIYNLTFHENFDWFLLVPDTTYVNPFELNRLIDGMSWNRPLAIGQSDNDGKCVFQGGILLSNPAIQLLLQERNRCSSIKASSDFLAFEACIQHATNLFCQSNDGTGNVRTYNWWHFEDINETELAIHKRIFDLRTLQAFNSSVSVSSLVSDLDAYALHNHFIGVELAKVDAELNVLSDGITQLERNVACCSVLNISASASSEKERLLVSWPTGLPEANRPKYRFQVPVWEYFTESQLFKDWPTQNVIKLLDNDARDVAEIILAARKKLESVDNFMMDFVRLRNGYRVFNALRGMDYVVDLEYHQRQSSYLDSFSHFWKNSDNRQNADFKDNKNIVLRRVYLSRPIFSTELLETVPFVKEDTNITLVIPFETPEEVSAVRLLISRHLRLCTSNKDDNTATVNNRQTRFFLAARNVNALTLNQLNSDLSEIKKRCKLWNTETALLVLPESSFLKNDMKKQKVSIRISAIDEAIHYYGQQAIYVLLSPYSDYHFEFLNRVRISTIRRYQAFSPIPFAEFNPLIVNSNELLQKSSSLLSVNGSKYKIENESSEALVDRIRNLKKKLVEFAQNLQFENRPISIYKDRGFFDTNDFAVFSTYGSDYLTMRENFSIQRKIKGKNNKTNVLNDDLENVNGSKEKFVIKEINDPIKMKQKVEEEEEEKKIGVSTSTEMEVDQIVDIIDLFVGQSELHVLRAVEPSLRLRFNQRQCPTDSAALKTNIVNQSDLKKNFKQGNLSLNVVSAARSKDVANGDEANKRCKQSQKNSFGMSSQIKSLMFNFI